MEDKLLCLRYIHSKCRGDKKISADMKTLRKPSHPMTVSRRELNIDTRNKCIADRLVWFMIYGVCLLTVLLLNKTAYSVKLNKAICK